MNDLTPITAALHRSPTESPASATDTAASVGGDNPIATIIASAEREIAKWSTMWPDMPDWAVPARRERIEMLRDIRTAAIGAQDHASGHEGFESAPAELDALVTEWGETIDYRTFPRLTDSELQALSNDHKRWKRIG